MKINFDIGDFIRRNLPFHMIQPNRLDLYWWIMRELDTIWKDYEKFRDLKDTERNITFSLLSVEWWLNYQLFGDGNANKLSIVFGSSNNYYILLENKDTGTTGYVELSQKSGATDSIELSRRNDNFGTITESFIVQSQITLTESQKEKINLIIEQYRTAGTNYKIIEL